jgi:hypothetical protein
MNIIEKYALNCGAKINKPEIYPKYFPMPMEKYIYFDPIVNSNEKNYDFWEEVISLISDQLIKYNIHILYINYKNSKPIQINQKIINLSKHNITKNQHAYLIKNCELYLGGPSFGMNVASMYDKKIVSIFGNTNYQNDYPYWSKKENFKIILPDCNTKPFHKGEDTGERINSIYPEVIAYSILDALNIPYEKIFRTLYIGKDYKAKTLEIIPEENSICKNININNPIIRMDYFFDEKVLDFILARFSSSIIFTNKPIDIEILKKYKNNISSVIYIVEEDNDFNFVKKLKNLGINFSLHTKLDLNKFNDLKLNYMDLGLIKELKKINKPNIPKGKIFYKTNKIILGKHGKFMTKFDWQNDRLSSDLDVPENSSFWEEDSNNLYLYTIDKEL